MVFHKRFSEQKVDLFDSYGMRNRLIWNVNSIVSRLKTFWSFERSIQEDIRMLFYTRRPAKQSKLW